MRAARSIAVAPSLRTRPLDRRGAVVADAGIGPVIEQQLDNREGVIAGNGVMNRHPAPLALVIRVNPAPQQVLHPFVVVPVMLADQHHREVFGSQPPRLDEHLHRSAVTRFRRMVDRFPIVRIRAPLDQQPGELGVVCDSRRAVERGLVFRILPSRPEPRVGIGTGIEQGGGCAEEPGRARPVQAEVLRETQVVQRVATVGWTLDGGVAAILGENALHRPVIAEDGGGVDVARSIAVAPSLRTRGSAP